jgi:hypothetical protein
MPNWLVHAASDLAIWMLLIIVLSIDPFSSQSGIMLALLLASNLIDLDHLAARPIYDKNRASIGFHLLHKKWQIPLYIAGCLLPTPYRYFFIGVCVHLLFDYLEMRTLDYSLLLATSLSR